jgi:CheY-like chemotaxis protein
VGRGSRFYFEIPATRVSLEAVGTGFSDRRVVGVMPGEKKRKLIIAEDQEENRLLLARILGPLGFEVRETSNGLETVDLAASWKPDLIWMDVRMPVMNGIEATRNIRKMPHGSSVRIVAVTAHALEEEMQEILAAGSDQCIRKPYRDAEIFEALERQLGVRFQFELTQDEPIRTDEVAVSRDELSAMPAEALTELAAVLETLNVSRSRDAIQRLCGEPTSARLCTIVEEYRFGELLQVVEQALNIRRKMSRERG